MFEENILVDEFDSEFINKESIIGGVDEIFSEYIDTNDNNNIDIDALIEGGDDIVAPIETIKFKIKMPVHIQKTFDNYNKTKYMLYVYSKLYPDGYQQFVELEHKYRYDITGNVGIGLKQFSEQNNNIALVQLFKKLGGYVIFPKSLIYNSQIPTWKGKDELKIWGDLKYITIPVDYYVMDNKRLSYGIVKNVSTPYEEFKISNKYTTIFDNITNISKLCNDFENLGTKMYENTNNKQVRSDIVDKYYPYDYFSMKDTGYKLINRFGDRISLYNTNKLERDYQTLKFVYINKLDKTLTADQKEKQFKKYYELKNVGNTNTDKLNASIDNYIYAVLHMIQISDTEVAELQKSFIGSSEYKNICQHKKDMIEGISGVKRNNYEEVYAVFDKVIEKFQIHDLGETVRGSIYCKNCMETIHEVILEEIDTRVFVDQAIYSKGNERSELFNPIIKDIDYIIKRYIFMRNKKPKLELYATEFLDNLLEQEQVVLNKNKILSNDAYEARLSIYISAYCCAFLSKIIEKEYDLNVANPAMIWKYNYTEEDKRKLRDPKTRNLFIMSLGLIILHEVKRSLYGKRSGEFNESMVQHFYKTAFEKISEKFKIAESGRSNTAMLLGMDVNKLYNKETSSAETANRFIFARQDPVNIILYDLHGKNNTPIPKSILELEKTIIEMSQMFEDIKEDAESKKKASAKIKTINPKLWKWNIIKKAKESLYGKLGKWITKYKDSTSRYGEFYRYFFLGELKGFDKPVTAGFMRCFTFPNYTRTIPTAHISMIYGMDGHIHNFKKPKIVKDSNGKIIHFTCGLCPKIIRQEVGDYEKKIEAEYNKIYNKLTFMDIVKELCPIDCRRHIVNFSTGMCNKCQLNTVKRDVSDAYYMKYSSAFKKSKVIKEIDVVKYKSDDVINKPLILNNEIVKIVKNTELSVNYIHNIALIHNTDIKAIDTGTEHVYNKSEPNNLIFASGIAKLNGYIGYVYNNYIILRESKGVLMNTMNDTLRDVISKHSTVDYDKIPILELFEYTSIKFVNYKEHYAYLLSALLNILNSLASVNIKILNYFVNQMLLDIHRFDFENSYVDVLKVRSEQKIDRLNLFAEKYLDTEDSVLDAETADDEVKPKKKKGDDGDDADDADDDDADEEIVDPFDHRGLDEDRNFDDEEAEINIRVDDR
jgi:hypothetical protein